MGYAKLMFMHTGLALLVFTPIAVLLAPAAVVAFFDLSKAWLWTYVIAFPGAFGLMGFADNVISNLNEKYGDA